MVDKVYQTYDAGVAGETYNNFADAILAVRDFAYPSIDYDVNWTITKTAGQWTQMWIDGSGKPDQDVTSKVEYLLQQAVINEVPTINVAAAGDVVIDSDVQGTGELL